MIAFREHAPPIVGEYAQLLEHRTDTACCNDTMAVRGRNAGEFATRMISPASAGSD